MSDTIKIMIVDDEPIIRKAIKYELNERKEQIQCNINDDGLVKTKEIEVLDTFANGRQLFEALNSMNTQKPDYLLLDMEFQGEPTGGITIASKVRGKYKNSRGEEIKIIILSGRFDNPFTLEGDRQERMMEIGKVVFESLKKGANAFVSKNAIGGFSIENIVRAIACLERGEEYYFNYPVMVTLKEMAELYLESHSSAPEGMDITDYEKELLLLEAAGCTAQEIANSCSRSGETDKSIGDKQKEISRKLGIVNKSGARIAKAMQYQLIDPHEIKFLKR